MLTLRYWALYAARFVNVVVVVPVSFFVQVNVGLPLVVVLLNVIAVFPLTDLLICVFQEYPSAFIG